MSKKEITFNDLTAEKKIELLEIKNSKIFDRASKMFKDKTFTQRYKNTYTGFLISEWAFHVLSAAITTVFVFNLFESLPLWLAGLFAIGICTILEWFSHQSSWNAILSYYSHHEKFSYTWLFTALLVIAIQLFFAYESGKEVYQISGNSVNLEIKQSEQEVLLQNEIDSLSSVKALYEGTTWKGRITGSASKSLVSLNSVLAMKESQLNDLKAVSLNLGVNELGEDKERLKYFSMGLGVAMVIILLFLEGFKVFRVKYMYEAFSEGLIVSDVKDDATITKQGDTKPKQNKGETTPKQKQIGFGNQRMIEVEGQKFRVSENEKGQPIVEMNGSWKTKASIQGAKRSYKSRGKLDKVKIYEEIANKMNVV